MGTYERNSWVPLPSEYLDTARCALCTTWNASRDADIRLCGMEGAAAFIASAAKHLPPSDVWCILYPSLKHFLRSDVRDVDEKTLLLAMKTPVWNFAAIRGDRV